MDTWDRAPSLPIPLDILLDILLLLPVRTVLALRQTSRSLCAVTRLRALWVLLFRRHVLHRRVPCPHTDTPIPELSASDLERLTHRALSLRRNWTLPHPIPRGRLTLGTTENARVIFLQFLPARANRWLISVRMTARPRRYLLQCWDVVHDHPTCVAELLHADGPYGGVVLNSDPNSPAVLALQSAQTETFSINFDADDPESAFETEAVIDGIRELHLLSGSTLVTRDTDEGGSLRVWDLADLSQEKLQLLSPSLVQPDDHIQAIHLAHDYALVVRLQSIELYSTTPCPGILPVRGAPIAYPLAQFKFRWRTDTVVLCELDGPPGPLPRPVHLLVRFGSTYPWPVNALHHYILRPNLAYLTGPRRRGPMRSNTAPATPSGSPTTPSSRTSTSSFSACTSSFPSPSSSHTSPIVSPRTTEYNLPYDLVPTLAHTISSPVRLFGQPAMALGRYGTALWLDNHTDMWQGGPSERGQRLAGRVLQHSGCLGGSDRDSVGDGDGHRSVADGDGVNTHGNACARDCQRGPGNEHERPAQDVISEWGGASMVFSAREDDAWTRVAMEEEAGRIAIGHVDGTITLLEY